MMKKVLRNIVVAMVILLSAISMSSVMAATGVSYWGGTAASGFASGSGSINDPYIIKNGSQLAYLASSVNSGNDYEGKYISLATDIYLNNETITFLPDSGLVKVTEGSKTVYIGTGIPGDTSGSSTAFDGTPSTAGTYYSSENSTSSASYGGTVYSWTPVGSSGETMFKGNFNGNGYTVYGVYIRNGSDTAGLFGYTDSGCISNVSVAQSYIHGTCYVGGIAGMSLYTDIVSCQSSAIVCGEYYVGGIAGNSYKSIINSGNSGAVCAKTAYAGGVAGISRGSIINAYNSGRVSGNSFVGGITGANDSTGAFINCYNAGFVSGNENVGAISGINVAATENCYYLDTGFDGSDAVSLSSSQMSLKESFEGFDFNNVWTFDTSSEYKYPILASFLNEGINGKNNMWSGEVSSSFASGDGTKASPYIIKNVSQLAFLAEQVNGGNDFSGKYIKLNSNITLNGTSADNWAPIGLSEATPFRGTFDGNGKVITGLYIGLASEYRGLFGYIDNGTVKNLSLKGVNISGTENVGGIVGCNSGIIENCFVDGNITGAENVGLVAGGNHGEIISCTAEGSVYGGSKAGGVTGVNTLEGAINGSTNESNVICGNKNAGGIAGSNDGNITEAVNRGEIYSNISAGGIAGENAGVITESASFGRVTGNRKTGGIAGINNGSLSKSVNRGEIVGKNVVGGVAGENTGKLFSSFAYGNVFGEKNVGGVAGVNGVNGTMTQNTNEAAVSGDVNCGGIAGENAGKISLCQNNGNIRSNTYAGGVSGYNTGIIERSANSGEVRSSEYTGGVAGHSQGDVQNCCNVGNITGVSYAGGIAGEIHGGNLSYCYSIGNVRGYENIGAILGSNSNGTVQSCQYLTGSAVDTGNVTHNGIGAFWYDDPTSDASGKTTGRTAEQLRSKSYYSGFNFSSIWMIGTSNNGYPSLRGMLKPASVTASVSQTTVYAVTGEKASVKVTASGEGLTYEWYVKNKGESTFSKSSVTSAVYSYSMSSAKTGREVYCVVTDRYGYQTTTETVSMRMSVSIKTQPCDVTVQKGQEAKTVVIARGEGLTYQWFVKNPGESEFVKSSVTKTTYSYTMTAAKSGREVYCVITDKYGNSVTTEIVTLSLEPKKAAIVSQPENLTVQSGEKVTVSFVAEGEDLSYEWYVKNKGESTFSKSSVTSATYSYTMTAAKSGREVYCVITDKYGNSVTTDTVTLNRA